MMPFLGTCKYQGFCIDKTEQKNKCKTCEHYRIKSYYQPIKKGGGKGDAERTV